MKLLVAADVPRDPNSGAAGTVFATNSALRELGHKVDEIWSDQLAPRRIRHGNLHSLLEQPRAYRREIELAVNRREYDVVMISQPQGYLAAKYLKKTRFPGLIINRSHGLELRADAVLPRWHKALGVPESRSWLLSRILKPMLHRQWSQATRWFDGFVVPCEMDRAFLSETFPDIGGKVVTIHHGV